MATTYTHPITDPKAADMADEALLRVGAALHRGTTAEDEAYAVRYVLAQYEEDDTGQYTPDDLRVVLDIIGHIVTSPRRHGHERTD